MDTSVFSLLGIITALGSALLLFRFDGSWLKALSFSGGSAILIGEFVALSEFFSITPENRSEVFVWFLSSWLITFLVTLPILLHFLKKQESRYKIHTMEILLGNKKAIDSYYDLKHQEIKKIIEDELDLQHLQKVKNSLEREKASLEEKRKQLMAMQEEIESVLDKKHCLTIPLAYSYPVTTKYFELLPRYIQSISDLKHHITSFTDSYVESIHTKKDISITLKPYLLGLSYYIGEFLFEWRDVRVHFRALNVSGNAYEKFVAVHGSGQEYKEILTPIPSNVGLIHESWKSKRSLVKSANPDLCFDTGNNHIWKDYITMVFDKLCVDGTPVLSLGISVKHDAEHRDMLYFLSHIQIEQILQDNLLKLNDVFPVANAALQEAV